MRSLRPALAPVATHLRRHIVLVALLVAGAAAVFAADRLATNSDNSSLGRPGRVIPPQRPARSIPLPSAARGAAIAFVESTVFRQDLAKGWTLVAHDSSVASGFSRAQFLSGAIPVVPFPRGSAMKYSVVHSHPRDVMLQVLLEPPAGRPEKATVFLLREKGVQQPNHRTRWLVTYWSPRPAYGVPSD
jgi:hypothetical protein